MSSSNHAKAFVQCCHGKHMVVSSRTLLSDYVYTHTHTQTSCVVKSITLVFCLFFFLLLPSISLSFKKKTFFVRLHLKFQIRQYLGTKSNLFLMSVTCKTHHSKITGVGGLEFWILLLLELASLQCNCILWYHWQQVETQTTSMCYTLLFARHLYLHTLVLYSLSCSHFTTLYSFWMIRHPCL